MPEQLRTVMPDVRPGSEVLENPVHAAFMVGEYPTAPVRRMQYHLTHRAHSVANLLVVAAQSIATSTGLLHCFRAPAPYRWP